MNKYIILTGGSIGKNYNLNLKEKTNEDYIIPQDEKNDYFYFEVNNIQLNSNLVGKRIDYPGNNKEIGIYNINNIEQLVNEIKEDEQKDKIIITKGWNENFSLKLTNYTVNNVKRLPFFSTYNEWNFWGMGQDFIMMGGGPQWDSNGIITQIINKKFNENTKLMLRAHALYLLPNNEYYIKNNKFNGLSNTYDITGEPKPNYARFTLIDPNNQVLVNKTKVSTTAHAGTLSNNWDVSNCIIFKNIIWDKPYTVEYKDESKNEIHFKCKFIFKKLF